MKRQLIISFAMFALLGLVLAGCSKQTSSEPLPVGPAVRLGAGVVSPVATNSKAKPSGADTRGVIASGTTFTASLGGWETVAEANYATPCTWIARFDAVADLPQPVQLTPQPYYNFNEEVKTYMKAWHPRGVPGADGVVTFSGDDNNFKGDGSDDVMLSTPTSGSCADYQQKSLEMRHLLSQLRFAIRSKVDLTHKPTLTSINLHGVQLPVGLNLATGNVVYADPADYPLRGIEPGAVSFTTTAQSAGAPVLLRPFDGNTLTVDIVTSLGTHNNVVVTIDTDAHFIPGKAYTITLTYTGLNPLPLEVTVSVSAWENINGGESVLPL